MKFEKITVEEFIFYLYFAIMVLAKGMGLVGGTVYNICLVVSTLLVICKIAVGRYQLKEYVVIGILLLLGIVIWRGAGNQAALICILLVLSMKNIDMRKAFRLGALLWGVSFGIQILTQLLNIRTRDFVIHNKFHLGYIIRWALGYTHPNVLQIAYVVLLAYIFYSVQMKGRKLIRGVIFAIAGGVYIFFYSVSMTGMIFMILFLLLLLFFEWERRFQIPRQKVANVLLECIFPLAAGISILGPVLLQGKAFDIINRLMTTRLELSKYFITVRRHIVGGVNSTLL